MQARVTVNLRPILPQQETAPVPTQKTAPGRKGQKKSGTTGRK